MQDLQLPTINEVIAVIISVILGTSAYLGYLVVYKKEKLNKVVVILVFMINCFVVFVASEAMKVWNLGSYRTVFLPIIAYVGQYLAQWFDKKNDKVFDAVAGKIGIDTKDKTEENIIENEDDEPIN